MGCALSERPLKDSRWSCGSYLPSTFMFELKSKHALYSQRQMTAAHNRAGIFFPLYPTPLITVTRLLDRLVRSPLKEFSHTRGNEKSQWHM